MYTRNARRLAPQKLVRAHSVSSLPTRGSGFGVTTFALMPRKASTNAAPPSKDQQPASADGLPPLFNVDEALALDFSDQLP